MRPLWWILFYCCLITWWNNSQIIAKAWYIMYSRFLQEPTIQYDLQSPDGAGEGFPGNHVAFRENREGSVITNWWLRGGETIENWLPVSKKSLKNHRALGGNSWILLTQPNYSDTFPLAINDYRSLSTWLEDRLNLRTNEWTSERPNERKNRSYHRMNKRTIN